MTDDEKSNSKEKKEDTEKPKIPKEELVTTTHRVIIDGQEIDYTAQVGTLLIKEEEEGKEPKPKASIFYIAYIRDGISDISKRPITFSFNGGPGSSSVWLHLGVLGPRRVIAEANDKPVNPPYRLIDNNYSLLDLTDLVFIDPVSTGFSRAVPGEKNTQFHEYKKDLKSVAEFIRLFTSRSKRWASPKFLIGESYGTTRAAGLSGVLQDDLGMFLNGIMLISSILNFQTARFNPGNDLPYILFLPTYTATAWYHKLLSPERQKDLQKTIEEVTSFTLKEYTLALMKGDTIPKEERVQILERLADLTGLSREYIAGVNLRINIYKFCKELLRKKHRTVGRLDTRYLGIEKDDSNAEPEYDPSYSAIQGPYTATFNHYVFTELNYQNDLPYEILSPIYKTWKYEDYHNQYLNVAETLRDAMSKNPFLKVFVGNGYYDLATPFLATKYTFNHLGLDSGLRKNIIMAYYEAGHMMYLHPPSLAKLRKDLALFIENALIFPSSRLD
ncbi:S10 family peptidase [Candidatus Hodarchaeum mangrovi]